MELKGKVVVVTGGASGMGAATATLLAKHGAKLALLDRNEGAIAAMANDIQVLGIECDVADSNSAEAAINKVVDHYGAVHGCINCAGIAPAARIVGRSGPMSLADFSRVIQVNLIGTFNIMRLCAMQMMQQDSVNDDGERGVIVNTASVAAFDGQVGQAAYSASKGGVVAMTLPAAREFGKFGIRVMTIAPGVIATPMMGALPNPVQESLEVSIPFPKRLGKPDEYAKLVQHIFENSYLNGETIRLDGAMRMA
jgi:NAD(P)-dependent dehydrogenase (short-subunit alcohol dehydrogenase family)